MHRDLKPENLVVGLNNKANVVYLLDFGLSKRYKDPKTGIHNPLTNNRSLTGTA